METASLRIKFTPLIKDFHKGLSKCCLEIVPEISATQNLDKIAWTVNEDNVEYTIPMTYKIIIRKKSLSNKQSNDLVKVYHSCVDLHNCSFSNIGVECRSVVRMLSDNILLNKLASNVERCSIFLTKEINAKELRDTAPFRKSIVEIKPENDLVADSSDTIIQKQHMSMMTSDEDTPATENSRERLTKCETNKLDNGKDKIFGYMKFKMNEVNTKGSDSKHIHDTYKRRLSLSPICSVNTCDFTPTMASNKKSSLNFDWQTFHSKINGSLKSQYYNTYHTNLVTNLKLIQPSNCTIEGQTSFDKNNFGNKNISNVSLVKRVLPEVRVACFLRKLESEILPLHMLLNEIKSKCLFLGVLNNRKEMKPNIILYKNLFRNGYQYHNTTLTNPLYYESVTKAHPFNHKLLSQESQIMLSTHKSTGHYATNWLRRGKSSDSQISDQIRIYKKGNDRQGISSECHNSVMNNTSLTKCVKSNNSNRVVYSIVYDYSE